MPGGVTLLPVFFGFSFFLAFVIARFPS